MTNPIPFLRTVALMEAVSFLLLLFVAMPLKYLGDQPAGVKYVGWAHGLLFIVFCGALAYTTYVARWPLTRALLLFVASLLPFGPFLIDPRMKRWQRAFPPGTP